MERNSEATRFKDLNPHQVRMLIFDDNTITAHLKSGAVLREIFPSKEALAEALNIWANKNEVYNDAPGPAIASSVSPIGQRLSTQKS